MANLLLKAIAKLIAQTRLPKLDGDIHLKGIHDFSGDHSGRMGNSAYLC